MPGMNKSMFQAFLNNKMALIKKTVLSILVFCFKIYDVVKNTRQHKDHDHK